MNNTLIDNSENLRMADKLRELILNPNCKIIKIATGFWDIPGLSLVEKQLREFLSKEGTELRLLIGSDPIVKAYQVNNPILKNSQFPEDYIKRELSVLDVKKDYIDSVRLILDFCQEIESDSKFKIRIYRTNDNGDAQFLHAKCYVFLSEKSCICGIIGSSNFTNKGLTDNAELNYIETASQIVASIPGPYNPNKGHNYWFDEKWNISKPWNKIFLEEVLKPTRVGIEAQKTKPEITPYELYIKYLQTQIGDIANPESKEILKSYLPVGFNAYGYQLDAVLQCFYIMKQHGGFVLSDVVGLGKTVVGTMLIKKFINEAALMGRSSKVLIITPPAIKAAWEQTINDFDKDKTDKILPFINFITTGSIAKILDISEPEENEEFDNDLQYDNYGLILIDESHNFRNKDSQKYKELDNLIQSIEIRVGVTPYIGLLSATPQNNAPKDIYNQILLFQREPNRSTLPNIPGGKLDSFMSEMNREFNELRKDESFKSKARLKEISTEIREKVLNDLVVRRTRHDIKNTYPEDCGTLRFPIVKGPHKLSYKLDSELCQLFYDTIDYIVGDPEKGKKSLIEYYRYAAIKYFVNSDNERLYEKRNLTVESITTRLANIMRILLVKRLESSFSAFKKSLHNLQRYTQNMIDMINANTVFICPDIDINGIIEKYGSLEGATPYIEKLILKKGGNNRCYKALDFNEKYIVDLKRDKQYIDELCIRWDANDYDPKLDIFKESINSRLFDPSINNPSGFDKPRLVVFSEAIDTINAIERALKNKGHNVLRVTADNRDDMYQTIKENFDANSKVKKDDYDVIVTTEVLAEGVNLHRANVILNYDTPWNSTRLMQRIGRINRIGSKEDFIHVFNFYPSDEGNKEIKLEQIAYSKLQAFHTMFGEDSKIFSENEELSEAEFLHQYEDELSPLSEYIKDLKDFQSEFPDRYKELALKPFIGIGGSIKLKNSSDSLVVISSEKRGITNVMVSKEYKTSIVAPITAMKFLKCDRNAFFSDTYEDVSKNISDIAISAYNVHVNQMRRAKETKGEIKKAITFLHDLVRPRLTSEGMPSYNKALDALRNASPGVARKILQFQKEYNQFGESLFGMNFDLDIWLNSTFGYLEEQANYQFGTPKIALIESKINKDA